ncbi:MAG: mandelate racemase/muconate lactonizing enzyme family protein [Pseudomonadota bacterium]
MPNTITAIEAIPVGLPFTQHDGPRAGFGGRVWETLDCLLVRVETSDGIIGWGDAWAYTTLTATKAALEDLITPLAVGQSVEDITGLTTHIAKATHFFGRSGASQYALGALDIALWDIAGKQAGLPVSRLLGGGGRTHAPSYASLFRIADTGTVRSVCEGLAADGFQAIKLHEVDPMTTLAAREGAGPDVEIMMDTNCPWNRLEAIEAARIMAPANLKWLEEPIWPPEDFDGLTELAAMGIPLAAGENIANPDDMDRLARTPGLAYAQPSVTKIGGISNFVRAGNAIGLARKRLAPHSPYFGPGLLATLHMASVFPDMQYVEMFGANLTEPLFDGVGLPDKDQNFAIPTGPGLGADPIPEVIEKFRLDR